MHPGVVVAMIASYLAIAGCGGMRTPVDGPVVRGFAPIGLYAGHWGIDFGIPEGTPVRAAADGTVAFVGVVAGNRTVSIDHGAAVRTSYSYLGGVAVRRGAQVRVGDGLGMSGRHAGRAALHFSLRVGGRYVDPMNALGCLRARCRGVVAARFRAVDAVCSRSCADSLVARSILPTWPISWRRKRRTGSATSTS